MSSAMHPMASTAWIMSEAVRRVQGRCAMVYYGSDVFPTLKAGQRLKEVSVYSAPDGTEQFDRAFRSLDGSLNLLNGTGARLLVVVSDGHYTPEETEMAKRWLKACTRNGVAVLWLPIGDSGATGRGTLQGRERSGRGRDYQPNRVGVGDWSHRRASPLNRRAKAGRMT
jgi:hypothetical protein